MAILFVLALLLAWPTFGLSLVAWFVWMFVHTKSKVETKDKIIENIEPLFQNKFGAFYSMLDVPKVRGAKISSEDATQCGRFIMLYLAQNQEELLLFLRGLDRWKDKGSQTLCDPVTAAEYELNVRQKSEVHLAAYRAIEALISNNRNLRCFASVDFAALVAYRMSTEVGRQSGVTAPLPDTTVMSGNKQRLYEAANKIVLEGGPVVRAMQKSLSNWELDVQSDIEGGIANFKGQSRGAAKPEAKPLPKPQAGSEKPIGSWGTKSDGDDDIPF